MDRTENPQPYNPATEPATAHHMEEASKAAAAAEAAREQAAALQGANGGSR